MSKNTNFLRRILSFFFRSNSEQPNSREAILKNLEPDETKLFSLKIKWIQALDAYNNLKAISNDRDELASADAIVYLAFTDMDKARCEYNAKLLGHILKYCPSGHFLFLKVSPDSCRTMKEVESSFPSLIRTYYLNNARTTKSGNLMSYDIVGVNPEDHGYDPVKIANLIPSYSSAFSDILKISDWRFCEIPHNH